ncbi:hypothetical protein HDU76_013928 [Blyttiomyces sp. JEL0837]|nr:hypothetical protein HDU76_013928 [Blyttiomyces sp. JEL0837]
METMRIFKNDAKWVPKSRLRRWLFKGIVGAVEKLHWMGVAHGDLKEENLLVECACGCAQDRCNGTCFPKVCLSDFGHAFVSGGCLGAGISGGGAGGGKNGEYVRWRYGTADLTSPEALKRLRNVRGRVGNLGGGRRRVGSGGGSLDDGTTSVGGGGGGSLSNGEKSYNIDEDDVGPPPGSRMEMEALQKEDVFALGLLLFALHKGPGELPWAARTTGSIVRGFRDLEILEREVGFGAVGGGNSGGIVVGGGGIPDEVCLMVRQRADPRVLDDLIARFSLKVSNGGGDSDDGIVEYPFELNELSGSVLAENGLGADLMRGMLRPDPKIRLNLREVLEHPWLKDV